MALVPENTYVYSYNSLPQKKKQTVEKSPKGVGEGVPRTATDGDLLWDAIEDDSEDKKEQEVTAEPDVKSEEDFEKQKIKLIKKIQLK